MVKLLAVVLLSNARSDRADWKPYAYLGKYEAGMDRCASTCKSSEVPPESRGKLNMIPKQHTSL